MTIKTLYYPTDAQIYFVDTIRIIIKYLKMLQHVSDHKGSIIRELYTVLAKITLMVLSRALAWT